MSGKAQDRFHNGLPARDAVARAFSPDGLGFVTFDGGYPVAYLRKNAAGDVEAVGKYELVDNDADPNTTPPESARIIRGATAVAFYPVWLDETQAVVVSLYLATGLTGEDEPAWVRVASVTWTSGAQVEWRQVTAGRDAVLIVESGVDDDHPLNVHAAAY
jgi:hypothetical protein